MDTKKFSKNIKLGMSNCPSQLSLNKVCGLLQLLLFSYLCFPAIVKS